MREVVDAIFLYLEIVIPGLAFMLALTLLFTDREEYRKNKHRTGKFWYPFLGKLHLGSEGARDPRVHAGLVFNRRTKKYETQYALSDEAVRAVLPARDR